MMYRLENNIIKTDSFPLDDACLGGVGYSCFKFMKKHSERVAQIDAETGHEEIYKTLLEKCIRTSIVLKKMGIEKGDVITFCSKTNLNSCVPLIASFFIGAIPSYLDATFHIFEITHFIKSIKPKLFLVTPDLIDTIHSLVNDEHQVIVSFGDDFFKPLKEEAEFVPIYVNDLQETAIIHFSSGSTGFPKGICRNHYSFLGCTAYRLENSSVENKPQINLSLNSFHWSVETGRLIYSIQEGACRVICLEDMDVKRIWNCLEKYKVNVSHFIPYTLICMLEHEIPRDTNLINLTIIFVEGSPLPTKYYVALRKLLPKVDIFPTYGQTEVGVLTTFRNIDLHREFNRAKLGSVGFPVPGVSLKVIDLETGDTLGPNKRGELFVKSRSVMNGYYNLDCSDQFDEDGWFKTGDLVYYDEDFCFFIVGRIKDMILFQGYHIIPALLETELLSHPAVKLAVVVSVPDDKDTEHALALVALHSNFKDITPTEIEKYVEDKLPEKYHLKGGVKIIKESYFQTETKIKRYRLKQLILSGEI